MILLLLRISVSEFVGFSSREVAQEFKLDEKYKS